MAISPIVNSFMQQGSEQMPQNGPVDANQMFTSQFSDMAFNSLRAKYPGLINNVVTMKTLATDLDAGTAFGVFMVSSGDKIIYVPVAMSDGSITSCEMAYDKQDDQFFPLNEHTVKEILAKSRMSEPTLLSNNPRVEDTRGLFKNMLRPPTSSNVVLASERAGIKALPNKYKKQFADWLENENPQLLGKIASFYDVEELAYKLSPTPERKTNIQERLPEFLRLDSLTKEAAELLDEEERKSILRDGFLVKKAGEEPLIVASPEKFRNAVEGEMHLTVYPEGSANKVSLRVCGDEVNSCKVGRAELLEFDDKGIKFVPVLVCGNILIAGDGRFMHLASEKKVLLKNLTFDDVSLSGFQNISGIGGLRSVLNGFEKDHYIRLGVFVKDRKNNWMYVNTACRIDAVKSDFNITDNTVSTTNPWSGKIIENDLIQKGYMHTDDNSLTVPKGSQYFLFNAERRDKKPINPVPSIEKLLSIMSVFGRDLTVANDGAGISITDKKTEKTASFFKRAEAAEWLHKNYNMNTAQINSVLDNKRSVVFEKSAFMDPSAEDMQAINQQPMEIPAEQGMSGEIVSQPNPQFQALEDFAETGEPDIFDSGVLASFSQYPDIKSLLVEYLPDFLAAEDKIGRIILLFSSQKKEIENFYGAEKCSTLMASCRRIFSILGDLVASLKLYVNMV